MTAVRQNVLRELERVDGAARIVCARRAGKTGIADLYQRAPCRVLFPEVDRDEAFTAVLLTTSGGLTGGDRLGIGIGIQDGAAATITTQAAEKIYRSMDGPCRIGVTLDVGADAWAEWLVQDTILFDGARISRKTEANVAQTGRLLAVESVVFGRVAMGETFRSGFLHDVWRIRRGGSLVWIDALKLDGDVEAGRVMPFGFANAAGYATLLYVGPDASRWLEAARAAIDESGARGGATSVDGLLVARLWSDDAAILRLAVARCVARLRSRIAGLPVRMPRVWSI